MASDFSEGTIGTSVQWFISYTTYRLKKFGGAVFGRGAHGQGRKTEFTEGSSTRGTSDFT